MSLREGHGYVHIDDWMRPAIAHGVRVASLTALGIAAFGLIAVAVASRIDTAGGSSADLQVRVTGEPKGSHYILGNADRGPGLSDSTLRRAAGTIEIAGGLNRGRARH